LARALRVLKDITRFFDASAVVMRHVTEIAENSVNTLTGHLKSLARTAFSKKVVFGTSRWEPMYPPAPQPLLLHQAFLRFIDVVRLNRRLAN
jgi:hypothetical protein